jgi:hypothetical protein
MNPWRSAKPKALSRSPQAESNRVCPARLLLNYKRLPYTTTWLEYPEIALHLKSLSVSLLSSGKLASSTDQQNSGTTPNETDTPYTIPTISLTPTHHIMDSVAIAAYLESTYPVPPIHPDAPEVATVEKAVGAAFSPIAPIIVSGIPRNLLNDSSKKHFEKGFEDGVGMSTEEFGRTVTREACLEKAREPWVELASLLKKNGGPFVRGMEGAR